MLFAVVMLALCYLHPLSCSVFIAQTVCLTPLQGREGEIDLVFYAQSAITVISGRRERESHLERERERETETETETERQRQRQRERQRERESK